MARVSESEAALARAVLIHGPLSRSALTSRLGLSPASLTRLAKPLIDSGLLVELDDVTDGSVGRPSRPLDISPGAGTFVGIKLTGDRMYAVATGIRAEPLEWHEREILDRRPSAIIDAIAALVADMHLTDLAGVGVSLGGVARDGAVEYAPYLDWRDVRLSDELERRLHVPVSVENDVVALAEAERWFGLGRGMAGFVTMTIGIGVGYGLVVGGQVVRTADAAAGTGGHIPLDPHGPMCELGHRGCAQAMLTSGSIAAQASAALRRAVDYEEVLHLARAGEPLARAVVDAAGDALGRFIALATNFTLQSAVVLAGEGVALYELVTDRVQAVITAERDPYAAEVSIHVDRSGFRAWARGAAAVAIQSAMGRIETSAR